METLDKYYKGENGLLMIGDNTQITKRKFCQELGITEASVDRAPTDWIKIDSKWFHAKERIEAWKIYNELLGEAISTYFHLDTVHSILAQRKFTKNYVLLTENFKKSGYQYLTIRDIKPWKMKCTP